MGSFKKKDNIIQAAISDDEKIVLDVDSGLYIGISGAALQVWDYIGPNLSVDDVIAFYSLDNECDIQNINDAFYLLELQGLIYECSGE